MDTRGWLGKGQCERGLHSLPPLPLGLGHLVKTNKNKTRKHREPRRIFREQGSTSWSGTILPSEDRYPLCRLEWGRQ